MSGETQQQESGWTVDTLRASIEQQFDAIYKLMDERKATTDEAGRVALAAQQTAMQTALEAAEKAVIVALLSAKEAVNKAEIAADKRFDNMNEFRQQLNDQASSFMPRTEADIRINAVANTLAEHVVRADENFTEIRTALSRLTATREGQATQRADTSRNVTIAVSVLVLLVMVASVLYALKP